MSQQPPHQPSPRNRKLISLFLVSGSLFWLPALFPASYALFPAVAQTTQDRKAEAEKLLQTGVQQYRQSKFREALESFQQALVVFQQLKDRAGEGNTLNNIGAVHNKLGQYPKALEFYQQALAILKQVGDRSGEGTTLTTLGECTTVSDSTPKRWSFTSRR